MKERPIIMSAESVLALLDKRKSQTRRVINPQPPKQYDINASDAHGFATWANAAAGFWPPENPIKCPYGAPGNRLWVKERWYIEKSSADTWMNPPNSHVTVQYSVGTEQKTDKPIWDGRWNYWWTKYIKPRDDRWRNPLFMPRWASRIILEILNVRVERLGDIDNEGALAEGVNRAGEGEIVLLLGEHGQPAMSKVIFDFAKAWNRVNEKRGFGWHTNPWVWVVEFRVVEVLDGNDFINRSVS